MNIKKHIPNTITLGNLLCGCLAIVKAFEGNLVWAAIFVGFALILDFFDGFTARLLKVASPIGKDLDSLADMVTFGVVPSIIMFQLIKHGSDVYRLSAMQLDNISETGFMPYVAFIIAIFSCIRLAKFNNDTRQTGSFIGLPTPANAMVICSIPLIAHDTYHSDTFIEMMLNPVVLCVVSVVMSFLLIAELPLFALKFKNFSWTDNKVKYLFLLASVLLLIILRFVAIPLIILLYILISIVNNIFSKKQV
ncbi:MAG: CDP-alcohol phosphatidyltransferase family protein [Bacteroidia bacterium]|nr:CDP-alcohol phosphatidyltransferase family protein [Bacteroidia bacterium]